MQTRSSSSRKEVVLCNQPVVKRKRPASRVFKDTDKPAGSTQPVFKRKSPREAGDKQREVPEHLYKFIQKAIDLEKQLQTSKKAAWALKSKLEIVNSIIHDYTEDYIQCEFLPSGWKYDPATAHTLVSKNFYKKETSKNMTPNPCIQYVQLDEREREAWLKFKEKDAAAGITAQSGIMYPIDKKALTPLSKKLALFRFIGDFAVQAFNKSYQMYVNKDRNENIQSAELVKIYYHKLSTSYLFRITIEATEQGYSGTYEATVECKSDDGAITLDTFIHKQRKASPFLYMHAGASVLSKSSSVYETVKQGWTDPEDYYEDSGMVRRRNKWGGYDFHNPNGWNRLRNY